MPESVMYKYWNVNGIGICIGAYLGGAGDVGAYIGASVGGAESEEYAVIDTHIRGAKLTHQEAFQMLPGLREYIGENGLYYRD